MPQPIAIVRQTGPGLSFQDSGRFGWRRYGVAPAGALDPLSAALANTLLGNPPEATVLEALMAGTKIEFLKSAWIALAGAGKAKNFPAFSARRVAAGERLNLTGSPDAMWTYIAIEGGWAVEQTLDSTSYHNRSGLGPVIREETPLLASPHPDPFPGIFRRYPVATEIPNFSHPATLRLRPGPHTALFTPSQKASLANVDWEISSVSDRTGYRLTSANQSMSHDHSIMSCPIIVGAVQIPPSGELIITLNDGPTLGGYPVIASVHPDDLPRLVQRPPGHHISLQWIDA